MLVMHQLRVFQIFCVLLKKNVLVISVQKVIFVALLPQVALVAFISNPKDVFERNAKPEFDEVAILDIDGGGIRSINYDPVLKNYVIANEVKDENGQKFSQLWTWSGNPTDEPQKISLPNLQHITNVEAVDSITVNGKPQMIVMGDEGNASQKITAKYMVVDYSQFGKQ